MNERESPGGLGVVFPQPGELWSLWDMLKIKAADFVSAIQALQRYEAIIIEFPDTVMKDGSDLALNRDSKVACNIWLSEAKEHFDKLGASTTSKAARDLLKALDTPSFTWRQWGSALRELSNTFKREIESVPLYVVNSRFTSYLEAPDPIFGESVVRAFPDAAAEITEAAKCLALRRNKAVVFHLMLAMEEAVRVLAAKKSATVKDGNGRWLPWLIIANNIDMQVIKSMAEGPEKVAWHNANSMLKSVGHAWRNPTDHPGASYSEEDAEAIFDAVKGFMKKLAPLV
jgi:hypothetical protein